MLDSQVTNHGKRLTILERGHGSLDERLTTVEGTLVALDARVTSLESTVADHETRLAALEALFPQAAAHAQTPSVAGIASTTYRMAGLGVIFTLAAPSRGWFTVDGSLSNSANGGETDAVLCYGTGTPPANGDLQTGTIVTQAARFQATSGGGSFSPFSLTAFVDALAPGAYWIDLALKASASSTASALNVDVAAHAVA